MDRQASAAIEIVALALFVSMIAAWTAILSG